jgi:hypothetical protein
MEDENFMAAATTDKTSPTARRRGKEGNSAMLNFVPFTLISRGSLDDCKCCLIASRRREPAGVFVARRKLNQETDGADVSA